MEAAFAPIEARSAKYPSASGFRHQFYSEVGKETRTRFGHFTTIVGENDATSGNKRVSDCYTQLAGQMIVAGARHPQPIILGRPWLMTGWGLYSGDRLDALQHLGHQGRSDAEIAIAAFLGHCE